MQVKLQLPHNVYYQGMALTEHLGKQLIIESAIRYPV
jgi:hypothetical protein